MDPPATDPYAGWQPPVSQCYQHPDRVAGAVCRRCGRPICPDCMREAPVGWQCATCVRSDSRQAPVTRWRPRRPGTLGNSRLTPVTTGLIALNVVIYLIESRHLAADEYRFGLVPYLVHARSEWYRLLTAAFLHASITHVLFNMLTLAIVGPAVESAIGRVRFGALYLLAALGGSTASYLASPQLTIGVGASGAIFGVMGGYFVLARRNGWEISNIGGLIVMNLVISFIDPAIDWRAHVGGVVTGAVVALGMAVAAARPGAVRWWGAVATSGAVLAVLALLTRLPPGHLNL